MPILIGWLIGDAAGRMMFSRTVMLMAVWVVVPLLLGRAIDANVGRAAGYVAAFAAPLLLLTYALHRTALSPLKLGLVTGLLLWCRFAMLAAAVALAIKLFAAGLVIWKVQGIGHWLKIGGIGFAAQAAITWWLRQSSDHEEAEENAP